MKKNKYLLLLLLLIIPLNVEAKIYINCKSPVKKGETFSCKVSVHDLTIKQFSATVPENNKNIEYVGATPLGPFTNSSSNRNVKFVSQSETTGDIANLKFKILDDNEAKIALKFINISTTLDSNTTNHEAITSNIVVNRTITTTITTKKVETKITTTQQQPNKEYSVIFNYNNGTNKTITKKCSATGANCNIPLTDLDKPERLSFKFNGWGNAETCTEGNTTTYKATGDTTLYACWTANVSDETLYLDSLSIENQELEFSKFNLDYKLTVLYEVENLIIKATSSDKKIKIDLKESYPLEVGENIITINLADDEKGTSNTYKINVTRLKEGEVIKEISNDATLSNISIKNHDLNFSPDVFEYTLQISSKTSSLDIEVKTNNEFAEYLVEGNSNLSDGSVIIITVKAEDGTINTYMINIESSKGIQDYLMYIIAGGLGVIFIILLVIIKATKNKGAKTRKQKISKAAPAVSMQTKNSTASIPSVKPISVRSKAPNAVPKQAPVTPGTPNVAPNQVPVTPGTPNVAPNQVPVTPGTPNVVPKQVPVTPVTPNVNEMPKQTDVVQPINKDVTPIKEKEELETLDL